MRQEKTQSAQEKEVTEALNEIGKALRKKGITLEEMIERGREIRERIIEEQYSLKEKTTRRRKGPSSLKTISPSQSG